MQTTIGIAVFIVGFIGWFGQGLSFFAPQLAVRLGVLERKSEMDETLYLIESKPMAISDMLLSWLLPLSALLMVFAHPLWPYLGLIGAGVTLYFSLLIFLTRIYLKHDGKAVGGPSVLRAAYLFALFNGVAALLMIVLCYIELSQ